MEQRGKLIALLQETFAQQYEKRGVLTAEHTADFLLENSVIAPPCKVGDTVYSIVEGIELIFVGEVYECCVGRYGIVFRSTRKGYLVLAFTEEDIGKTVFLSREEAEKALAERMGIQNE